MRKRPSLTFLSADLSYVSSRSTLYAASAIGCVFSGTALAASSVTTQPLSHASPAHHSATPQFTKTGLIKRGPAGNKASQNHLRNVEAGSEEQISVRKERNSFEFASAQHTPDSATRLSGARLIQQGVTNITGIQNLAPNFSVQQSNGTATPNFTLRGVGMQDITNNNTQSVMAYVDGVAYPFASLLTGQWFDIADVSVNPGPVGFEHGQADTGGEVNIRTSDPTDTWHAGISEDIASYARSKTDFYVSGPIAKNLSFRLAGQTLQGGGWQYSPTKHEHLGDMDTSALRGKLKWTPDSETVVKVTGYWVRDHSELVNGVTAVNSLPSRPGNVASLNSNTPAGSYVLPYRQTEWSINPDFAHLIGRSSSLKPSERNLLWGGNVFFERNLGFGKLQSISSYNTEHRGEFVDEDASTWTTTDEYRTVSTNSFSQELRLTSNNPARNLQWSVGAYYNRAQSKQNAYMDFTDYTPARGYLSLTKYNDDQQTFAQYAHISYRLPAHVTIFGGINHEADDRQLYNLHTVHFASKSLCGTRSCQATTQDLNFKGVGANSNQFSGELGVQWQPIQTLLTYFKVSKGFKPSALTANNTVVQDQLIPSEPETVLSFQS
ncbi:MAG: TonB-dependent receptor plug domain-containing protein [Gluconobacter cerinus]|uniref:TonB-dependent receptor n=1 Tax=Gluconobacter TaxID=441 RepID=UPI0039E80ACB